MHSLCLDKLKLDIGIQARFVCLISAFTKKSLVNLYVKDWHTAATNDLVILLWEDILNRVIAFNLS